MLIDELGKEINRIMNKAKQDTNDVLVRAHGDMYSAITNIAQSYEDEIMEKELGKYYNKMEAKEAKDTIGIDLPW